MQLLINHLTRMQSGFICTAGIDLATGGHVRPVVRGAGLRAELLASHGGPLDIAAVVELGHTKYAGQGPHIEDYLFDPKQAHLVREASPEEFRDVLRKAARPSFTDLFGRDLTPHTYTSGLAVCTVPVGKGIASLGCLAPAACPDLYVRHRTDKKPQVRLRVRDTRFDLDLGVTDLRLYGPDRQTPDEKAFERAGRLVRAGAPIILSVGLTRLYSPTADQPQAHWLQVNNLHFVDEPIWRMGS